MIAYVLHKKAYKETGWLLTLLTETHGKVTALLRGARKENGLNVELFNQFELHLKSFDNGSNGFNNYPKAHHAYSDTLYFVQDITLTRSRHLNHDAVWLAFYMNELLCLLVPKNLADVALLNAYQGTLDLLNISQEISIEVEWALRIFEMRLLDFIGLLPNFLQDEDGKDIQTLTHNEFYLSANQGLLSDKSKLINQYLGVQENHLLLSKDFLKCFHDLDQFLIKTHQYHLQTLKKTTRFLIQHALQGRTLKSKDMLKKIRQSQMMS